MAISAATAWDIQTGGNDAYGGGFDPAFGGADASQSTSTTARNDIALDAVAAPSAPTAAAVAGGSMTAGVHKVRVTYWNTNTGTETDASTNSDITTDVTNKSITVTSPGASEGATHYRVYITTAGTTTYYLMNSGTPIEIGTDFTRTTEPSGTSGLPAANTLHYYTSSGTPFVADDKGNIVNTTAGTGFTTGRFQIKDFTATSSRAYLDRSGGTAGSTNGTGNLGGCLATPGMFGGAHVASNKGYLKAGTYTMANSNNNATGGRVSLIQGTDEVTALEGYSSTHGDRAAVPIIEVPAAGIGTNSVIACGATFCCVGWIKVDLKSKANATAFTLGSSGNTVLTHCVAINAGSSGFGVSASNTASGIANYLIGCDFSAASVSITGQGGHVCIGCTFRDHTASAVSSSCSRFVRCVAYGNSGASSDGFTPSATGANNTFIECIADGNGRDGFRCTDGRMVCINCIATNNTGTGFDGSAYTSQWLINCAGYGNGADYTVGFPSSRIIGFVTLGADPYVNAATNNYALNANSPGGAQARAAGYPGALPDGASTGYPDIGAVQHADPIAPGALPAAAYVYNGIDRGDGVTGTLRASNIATGAGAPGVDLAAADLKNGVTVDDVTGSYTGGVIIVED